MEYVLAMYLPSLFSAYLVSLFGIRNLMLIGSGLYVAVVVISLVGSTVTHYWSAMVLLGIGWNFLFLSGTLLLPQAYEPQERFKVQAVNDFSIFTSLNLINNEIRHSNFLSWLLNPKENDNLKNYFYLNYPGVIDNSIDRRHVNGDFMVYHNF